MKEKPHTPKYINPFTDFGFKKINKEERSKYEESLKYYNDLKNSLDTAFDEGKEEARVELLPLIEKERRQKEEERRQKEEFQKREKEALQTITKMIKQLHTKGVSVSEISAMTGKTEEEIKKILK